MDTTDSAPKPVYTVDICRFPPDWTRVKHVRLWHSLWLGTAPETHAAMAVTLPDEKTRRVGQSVAAASLPRIG